MSSLALVLLFFVMIAAPCTVAILASRMSDEADALDIGALDTDGNDSDDAELPPVPAGMPFQKRVAAPVQPVRPPTLEELVAKAESAAFAAQEIARQAHWNSLAAAARLAALRADAAAEAASIAGMEADAAIRAAEAEFDKDYLPETHPSLDFPRSSRRGRAA